MKNRPPLNFLRSFEASARHLSFTDAARELNCTQAAISQHIRSLETSIGRPLFERTPRSLTLTEVGESYLPAVRDALTRIDLATEAILAQPGKQRVIVSCPVTLAALWLTPLLHEFNQLHPDIEVTVHGTVWGGSGPEMSDLHILLGRKDVEIDKNSMIVSDELALVCAPSLLEGDKPLGKPEDIHNHTLIHVLGYADHWSLVARTLNIGELHQEGGLKTDSTTIALEYATTGAGLIVTQRILAQRYIERGLLIEPFPVKLHSKVGYYLHKDAKLRLRPAAKTFHNWLIEQGNKTLGD
ncbi:LysR substrate-binding domain-containing protein [Kiloniella sp. b19]|uniref:LysR substrate-binding domain-containing protein n=1 Tax=Kiloniella sp. GXU_MW_B19 TaxID=3141326 RepID=UPI0031E04BD0